MSGELSPYFQKITGAETRAIEFAAHVLIALDGDVDAGAVTLRVVKNRRGPKTSFPIRFDRERADFSEIAPEEAEAEASQLVRSHGCH